jgi:hypothetical protein
VREGYIRPFVDKGGESLSRPLSEHKLPTGGWQLAPQYHFPPPTGFTRYPALLTAKEEACQINQDQFVSSGRTCSAFPRWRNTCRSWFRLRRKETLT